MVDTRTGEQFPRLKLLCLGYIIAEGDTASVIAPGPGGDPTLLVVVNKYGPDSDSESARVVEVDLHTYAVTRSKVFAEGVGVQLVSALGEVSALSALPADTARRWSG